MKAEGGVSERLKEKVLKTFILKRYREFESRPHRQTKNPQFVQILFSKIKILN